MDDDYQNDKNNDINNYEYDYYFYDIKMPSIEHYYVVDNEKESDDDSEADNDFGKRKMFSFLLTNKYIFIFNLTEKILTNVIRNFLNQH